LEVCALGGLKASRSIRTVLVVDDDDQLLRAYQSALGPERRVIAAKTIAAATAVVREHTVDLAIVDFQLRGECGIDLIAPLKDACPGLVFVLVTGYGSMDVAARAARAGADEVLAKPITYAEILARVSDPCPDAAQTVTPTLARAQWEHIHRVLKDSDGNVSMAARKLGVYRSTLQRWLRRHAPRT
jgi:two-component system response regulator RegA